MDSIRTKEKIDDSDLVVVDKKAGYDEIRQFFADLKPFGEQLNPKTLRIRKIWSTGNSLGALDETMCLKDLNIYDKMWVGVQILPEEEVLKSTDRVVQICRWFPEKKECGERKEMKIDATMKVKDGTLAKWFEDKFGIEAEHVRFQKTINYYITTGKCSDLDWELAEISDNATLARQPVLLKHGDDIIYKDNREKESGKLYERRRSFKFVNRRAERGIKIKIFGGDDDDKKDVAIEDKEEEVVAAVSAEAESGEEEEIVAAEDEKMSYDDEPKTEIEPINFMTDHFNQGASA